MDRDKLKALAEAATPGPWKLGSWLDNIFSVQGDSWLPICRVKRDEKSIERSQDKNDAAYIAAAHPAAILELIRQLEAAEAETERLRDKAIVGEYMWTPDELHAAKDEAKFAERERCAKVAEAEECIGRASYKSHPEPTRSITKQWGKIIAARIREGK